MCQIFMQKGTSPTIIIIKPGYPGLEAVRPINQSLKIFWVYIH